MLAHDWITMSYWDLRVTLLRGFNQIIFFKQYVLELRCGVVGELLSCGVLETEESR
jgi:hypothetical protein